MRDGADGRDAEGGRRVTLSFSPLVDRMAGGATRAVDPDELEPGDGAPGSPAVGKAQDSRVSHLRILVYSSSTGRLVKNLEFTDVTPAKMPLRADVLTGLYDFVFVVNSVGRPAASGLNAAMAVDANVDHISKLRRLTFDAQAHHLVQDGDIPMVEWVSGVEVKDDNLVRLPGAAADLSGAWPVTVTRAAVRLSMEITLTKTQYSDWKSGGGKVTIGDVPGSVGVMPGYENGTGRLSGDYVCDVTDPLLFADADESASETTTVYYDRIILPELLFSDIDDEDMAMELGMTIAGNTKKGKISAPASTGYGYTLPRNTWLHLSVTIKADELQITPRVRVWNGIEMEDVTVDGDYELEVDRSVLAYLQGGGTQQLGIRTNHPDGWAIPPLSAPFAANFSPASEDDGDETQSAVTATVPTANPDAAPRYAYYLVSAGPVLRKRISVVQAGSSAGNVPANVTPYVGAFWKADQTGERLIRVARPTAGDLGAIDGGWSATVLKGGEWIRLSNTMTLDSNVGWRTDDVTPDESAVANGGDPGFDNKYPVFGEATHVEGRMDAAAPDGLFFRIGLADEYLPTEAVPARYGIVLVSYADGAYSQLLFVRQGEGADYLFHRNEGRAAAVPFSPYNLTVKTDAEKRAFESDGYVQLQAKGGAFTDYPTQAGAFFQFGSTANPRYAFDPTTQSLTGVSWDAAGAIYIASSMDACPPGYRRPTAGEDSTNETGQSLWEVIPDDNASDPTNSIWGYYADGFFDRRKIDGQPAAGGGVYDAAVAIQSPRVAYVGRLMFNDIQSSARYGASTFFPASGYRSNTNGSFRNSGSTANYWSMSPFGVGYGMDMGFDAGNASPATARNVQSFGFPIRCVFAPPPPLPKGVPAAPGVLGYVYSGTDQGRITLRGSVEFEGTPLEQVAEDLFPGEGLYNVPVYMARFKFGSLVAYTSRGWEFPTAANDGVLVTPNDLVAAPSVGEGYPLGLDGLKAETSTFLNGGGGQVPTDKPPYANRPPSTHYYVSGYPTWWDDMSNAWGDPCKFYSDKAGEGAWRMPTPADWYDGYPSSTYNVSPADDYTDSRWIDNNREEYKDFPVSGAVVVDNAGNPMWPLFVPMWYELKDGNMGGQLVGGYWVKESLSSSVAVYGGNSLKGPDAGLYGDASSYLKQIRPVRCISPFFVNPTSLAFEGTDNTLAEAKSVTVTAEDTWSVTAKSSWLAVEVASGTGNATVGIYPNEAYQFDPTDPNTPRAGFVTFTSATGMNRTVAVTQKQVPPPNPRFMLASPGVIGIKDSDYRRLTEARTAAGNPALLLSDIKLTIQGSSTFKGYAQFTNATTDAKYGPLEDEPVYMVNFLWGSLFGRLLSQELGSNGNSYGDAWSTDGSDIVWKNSQYTGSTALPWDTVKANWGSKTNGVTNTANEGKLTIQNLPAGHGDPCNYVGDGAWHTPTRREWLDLLGGPGTAAGTRFNTTNGDYKWTPRNLVTGSPTYATFPQCLEWPDFSLPKAMWNDSNGKTRDYDDNEFFMYQTTTQLVANTLPTIDVSAALYLEPTEASTRYGRHSFPGYFLPVRCFRN
jgi:hypothetical protein